jgi:hypothetical protein
MFRIPTSSLECKALGGAEGCEEKLESKFLAGAFERFPPEESWQSGSCEKKVNEADVLWRSTTISPWCGQGTRSRLMGSSLPWAVILLVCIRWGRRGGRLRGLRTRRILRPPRRRRGSEVEVEDEAGRERVGPGPGRSGCGVIFTGVGDRLASEAHTRLL